MSNIEIVLKDSYNFVFVKLKVFADLRSANIKIIIADFFPSTARVVMCEAYKQVGTIFLIFLLLAMQGENFTTEFYCPTCFHKKGVNIKYYDAISLKVFKQ